MPSHHKQQFPSQLKLPHEHKQPIQCIDSENCDGNNQHDKQFLKQNVFNRMPKIESVG